MVAAAEADRGVTEEPVASLPMYDGAALRPLCDAWWRGIDAHCRNLGLDDVPAALAWPDDLYRHWKSGRVFLSQTCGYPLTHALKADLRLVATPCYRAEGCDGPLYRSRVLARAGDRAKCLADFKGRRVAYNDRDSQSGYNALRAAVAAIASGGQFFADSVHTGSHGASMAAVRDGLADLCAVDCVTFAVAERFAPETANGLKTVGWTDAAPGLPYVTSARRDGGFATAVRRGLMAAAEDSALADVRDGLLLTGFTVLEPQAYAGILEMERAADEAGYPSLA